MKPVKHLFDCKKCFVKNKEGLKIREKSICLKCDVYDKCIAKQTDKVYKNLGL